MQQADAAARTYLCDDDDDGRLRARFSTRFTWAAVTAGPLQGYGYDANIAKAVTIGVAVLCKKCRSNMRWVDSCV